MLFYFLVKCIILVFLGASTTGIQNDYMLNKTWTTFIS